MVTAEAKLVFEVNCPHCGRWNRFHDLAATHANLRRRIQFQLDGKEPPDVTTKCEYCERHYDIDKIKLV